MLPPDYNIFFALVASFLITYVINPKTNLYYVASLETMGKSFITKLLTYAGAILIQRSWRDSGESVSREVRTEDPNKIKLALKDGWVITFPRGTTDSSRPVRRGTAHIIKNYSPLKVPIKLLGFNDVFQRNGLKILNRKKTFSMEICKPIGGNIYENSIDEITSELPSFEDNQSVMETCFKIKNT